jgi:5S rRNA maturation endonuclease (ribonuclease M5)
MIVDPEQVPPLAELQEWGREDWEQFDPVLWGDSPAQNRVIEAVIHAGGRELRWQGAENANSLRDFWYNPVKPILQRAFPEEVEDPGCDFNRKMSKKLSGVLSDMVKAGEITYRSLNILDESRERQIYEGTVENDKVLFVEKNAAYRKLRPLGQVYELSVVSGGGWQATALIEDLAYALDRGREYTVYLLTDYDPTGFKIGRDFSRRADLLGLSIERVERVGVDPDQLDAETVARQRFKPSVDTDFDEDWMGRHAINGEFGLEIEALGDLSSKGEDLRQLVVDELRGDIRTRSRRRSDVNDKLIEAVHQAAGDVVDEITNDLRRAINDEAADVIEHQDGVISADPRNGWGDVDLSTAEAGRDLLPDPYAPEELHEGAVDGERPQPNSRQVRDFVADELQDRIDAGELDLGEYLDVGGGA